MNFENFDAPDETVLESDEENETAPSVVSESLEQDDLDLPADKQPSISKHSSTSTIKKAVQELVTESVFTEEYDHLHQLFLTKNPVLCREVERNFNKLSHSYSEILSQRIQVENAPLPTRFQDAHPAAFPYFLTLREFLVLLGTLLFNSLSF